MPHWSRFADFLREVQITRDRLQLRPHQECYYRGHSDTNFELLPSLFRGPHRADDEYWKLERRMFFEFRTRARQLYGVDHSDWDVLFHMQHHGVPTRLLDWTSVFGVALYFALLEHQTDVSRVPCVWIMNPYALNHQAWEKHRLFSPKYLARDDEADRSYEYGEVLLDHKPKHWKGRLGWQTPLAIYSLQRSERMFAQGGVFTIHGTDPRPINEIFSDRADILKKVEVPEDAIPAAQEFLTMAGIVHRQMFPDLDGLARSLREKHAFTR
jgi:hypothetical protein